MGNKLKEENHFNIFKSIYKQLPVGTIVHGDSPDFILSLPEGGKIGIEFTDIYQPSRIKISHKSKESEQDMIVEGAESEYRNSSLPHLSVGVSFNDCFLSNPVIIGLTDKRVFL